MHSIYRAFLPIVAMTGGCSLVPVSLGDGAGELSDATSSGSDSSTTDASAEACASSTDPICVPFGPPKIVAELSSGDKDGYDENPTLTANMLEIYFSSTRDGGPGHGDVWRSVRDSVDASWSPPSPVQSVSSSARETSPAVTFDGLSLYVASDRDGGQGGYDIWMASRPNISSDWSEPAPVVALNSAGDEIPRPIGDHSLAMPMSRRPTSNDSYQIYMAYRASSTSNWDTPELLSWVDTPNLDVDGFLTDDALFFSFASDRLGNTSKQNLFLAFRTDTQSSFGTPEPMPSVDLDGYNSADPWLSPDLHVIYFSSDRSGVFRIYQATR